MSHNLIDDSIIIYDRKKEKDFLNNCVNLDKNIFLFSDEYFDTKKESSVKNNFKQFAIDLYEEEIESNFSNLIELHKRKELKLSFELFFFDLMNMNKSNQERIKNLEYNLRNFLWGKENETTQSSILKLIKCIENYQKICELSEDKNFVFLYSTRLQDEDEITIHHFMILLANILKYNKLVYKKYF